MRNKYLDNAKWILTLLMVLYHIQFLGDSQYNASFMAIKNLGDSVVTAFSIISGFLFWSTVNEGSDLRLKILRRVRLLLIPYVLWNIINTLFVNWQGGKNGIGLFDLNLWNNIIMWNSSPHFWYIFMLMFWTVLSPILFFLYRKKVGIVILLLLSVLYLIYKGNNVLHSRFIYIIYLWSGVAAFYFPDLVDKICFLGRKRKIICVCALILYLGIYYIYSNPNQMISMGIKVWLYCLRAVFLLVGLLNMPVLKLGSLTKFRYSFWIFAVHYWLDAYFGAYIFRYVSNIFIYQFLTWISVIGIGGITGIILNYMIPPLFKLLSGNRE